MSDLARYAGQAAVYGLVCVFIAVLASWPRVGAWPVDAAEIKLSLAHGAQRKEACRRLTSEEIAKLPPNQRRPNTCARERLSIRVQIEVDGRTLYDAVLQPTGLSGDGPARVYQKFRVTAGRHQIVARLRDSDRVDGFDYESRVEVDLSPLQSLAVDFRRDQGQFVFR